MAVPGGFPARGLWRRPALRWPDVLVVAALLALLYGLLRLGSGAERAVPAQDGAV